jgi:dynein heavy chain, axonemal
VPRIAADFLANKDKWYSIATSCADPDVGFNRLDLFFKSVTSIMSNQLWEVVAQSLQGFENFFTQFGTCSSDLSVFLLKMSISGAQIRFDPPLSNLESKFKLITDVVISILNEIVLAVTEIPRIETKLFTSIAGDPIYLPVITPEDERISDGRMYRRVISINTVHAQKHLMSYEKYKGLLNHKSEKKVEDFLRERHELDEYEGEIQKLTKLIEEIGATPSFVQMSMIYLDCEALKMELTSKANQLVLKLVDQVADMNRKANIQICESYEKISAKAMSSPNDTQELVELMRYVENAKQKDVVLLRDKINRGKKRLDFLLSYAFMTEEDIKLNGVTLTWPTRILPIYDLSKKRMMQKKTKVQEDLKVKIESTNTDLDECYDQAVKFQDYGILSEINTYTKKIKDLETRITEIADSITKINQEEELLEWEKTPFARQVQTIELLDPYKKLWETALDFQTEVSRWMNGPFKALVAEEVDEQVNNMFRTSFKLVKTFSDNPVPKKVAESIKSKLEKFKNNLPLITCLSNPGLNDRHWVQMAEIVGQPLLPDESTSLSKILELNLGTYLPQFEAISDAASKEHSLLKTLRKMREDWEPLTLTFIKYKDTGTKILTAIEEVQVMLDDQIVKVQTMRGSPFVKPLEEDVKIWESTLISIQDIIDAWLKVQSTWLYLEPIFTSEDITAGILSLT